MLRAARVFLGTAAVGGALLTLAVAALRFWRRR